MTHSTRKLLTALQRGQLRCDQWNRLVPIGTHVRYWPVTGDTHSIETRTRSIAWPLGHGAPVVLIEGKTGGVLLDHVQIIDDDGDLPGAA